MSQVLSLRVFALKTNRKMRKKSVEVKCLCQFHLAVGAQKFIQTFIINMSLAVRVFLGEINLRICRLK